MLENSQLLDHILSPVIVIFELIISGLVKLGLSCNGHEIRDRLMLASRETIKRGPFKGQRGPNRIR